MPPKSAETRKELICQLMKEPSYVPMREKELACIMQVEREDREEFARLLAEKKAAYAEYHRAQERMRELLIHKANAAYLLGLNEQNRQTPERQREEK